MATQDLYLFKELTHLIIGAAMEVHRILGSGYLESVYHEALAHELHLLNVRYAREVKLQVKYKGIVAGDFRADFIVDDKVVVEIKAINALTRADEAQVINYLRATSKRVRLLINFGKSSLEYRRFVL
jgi:GxxExxY protein